MTQPADDTEDMTELVNAQFSRVDAVAAPANGTAFLIAKARAEGHGLMKPEFVRDLIAKSDALETPVTDAVSKAEADDVTVEVSDLIAATPPASMAESTPGSPDWENKDGDTALNALAVLGRVQAVIGWLVDREATEAVTADPDDAENAFDLQGAAGLVQCAIDTLAAFAAGEKLEADLSDEMEAVGKAVAPLTVLEGLAPLAKAGRVLSASNETAIRGAVESLSNVLSTLPAPIPDDGQPVAKTKEPELTTIPEAAPVADEVTKALVPGASPADIADAAAPPAHTNADKIAVMLGAADAPVAKAVQSNAEKVQALLGITDSNHAPEPDDDPLRKAKGDPMTPVYDANGELVGLVEAKNLVPVATAAPADPDAGADPGDPEDGGDPAETPEPTVAAPQPPDAATIPGTQTVQAPTDDNVTKAAQAASAAFTEALAPLAKQLEAVPGLASAVEVLKEQFAEMLKMPDDRKSPRLNGANGVPGVAQRSEAEGDPFAALRKAAADELDPIKKRAALNTLMFEEVKARVGRPNPLM